MLRAKFVVVAVFVMFGGTAMAQVSLREGASVEAKTWRDFFAIQLQEVDQNIERLKQLEEVQTFFLTRVKSNLPFSELKHMSSRPELCVDHVFVCDRMPLTGPIVLGVLSNE